MGANKELASLHEVTMENVSFPQFKEVLVVMWGFIDHHSKVQQLNRKHSGKLLNIDIFRYPPPSTEILYLVFTFSKEYWQLAMTRQNWNTQKSLKQPWLRSTKPRKETRKPMKTATRFSTTSWFLYKKHT